MSDTGGDTLIAPSLLASDLACLSDGLDSIESSGADWVHWDVMDNAFVPNLTFGPPVIAAARDRSDLPFDVHIMVREPGSLIGPLAEAGADLVSFHIEATDHAPRLANRIRERGMAAGVVLNPQTPVSDVVHLLHLVQCVLVMTVNPGYAGQSFMRRAAGKLEELERIRRTRGLVPDQLDDAGLPESGFLLEVDGGVSAENATALREMGADVLVTGSAFFSSPDRAELVRTLRGSDGR